jgi:hypothetical protein
MTAIPDKTAADPQQIIAELERKLDERTSERDEALERQTATAGILQIIASSPSDVQPVFDAIAERSKRLVNALSTTVFGIVDGMMHLTAFTPTNPEADATLEIVGYLKTNPGYASQLYVQRTKAAKNVAEKAVASLNRILAPSGRGSGNDLAAAVAGNWQFIVDSGAVPANSFVKIEDVVETRFLPPL